MMKKRKLILSTFLILFSITSSSYSKTCKEFNSPEETLTYVKSHQNQINDICNDQGSTLLSSNVGGWLYDAKGNLLTRSIVHILLEAGADPNKDKPLMSAVFSGNIEIIRELLQKGANANVEDETGNTVLTITKDEAILDLLISYGANVNHKNKDGMNPLQYMLLNKDLDKAEYFYNHGAFLNFTDKKGNSILIQAMKESCDYIILEWLVQHGAPVNKQNHAGLSPLMVAAYTGDLPAVKLFLKNGANPYLVAKNGQTAFDFAKNAGRRDIANYLIAFSNNKKFKEML